MYLFVCFEKENKTNFNKSYTVDHFTLKLCEYPARWLN